MGINQRVKNKAVFLDRDGVLNEAIVVDGYPYPPNLPADLVIPSDVLTALIKLKKAGFLLIVVTNQPDVARKKVSQKNVEEINSILKNKLPIDEFYICYHDDVDQCACRKPLPGLLLQAVKNFSIDLNESFMIGDRWRDIVAGKNAGCKTIWLNKNYSEKKPVEFDLSVTCLNDAVDWIVGS